MEINTGIDLLNDIIDDNTSTKSGARDISDNLKDIQKTVEYIKGISKRLSIKSMSRGTICQYPMLFSTGISMDTAPIISKAFEHEYINILIIILNDQIETEMDLSNATTTQLLTRFHTNLSVKAEDLNIDKYIGKDYSVKFESFDMHISEDVSNDIKHLNEIAMIEFDTSKVSTLNEMSVPSAILNEATGNPKRNPSKRDVDTKIMTIDTKKINSLAPTVVKTTLKFAIKDSKGNVIDTPTKEIVFGVKAIVHTLETGDIIYNLTKSLDDSNWMLKLIRWTTGEIRFFKDILFSVDEAKKKALRSMKGRFKIWDALEEMSEVNKIRNMATKNKVVATATMILTKSEVDRIKNAGGVDILSSAKAAETIMKNYFLLNLAILDEPANILYIYDEEYHEFAYYSMNAIKAFSKEEIDMNNPKSLLR